MSNFIENIVARHTESALFVKPRVRGLYEAPNPISSTQGEFARNTEGGGDVDNGGQELSPEIHRETPIRTTESDYRDEQIPTSLNTPTPLSIFMPTKDNRNIENTESLAQTRQYFTPQQPPQKLHEEREDILPRVQPFTQLFKEKENSKDKEVFNDVLSVNKAILAHKDSEGEAIKPTLNRPNLLVEASQNNKSVSSPISRETAWLQNVRKTTDHLFNPPQAPVIKVTIGRIEVRALPASSPPSQRPQSVQKPQMSLEDYLKKQNNNTK